MPCPRLPRRISRRMVEHSRARFGVRQRSAGPHCCLVSSIDNHDMIPRRLAIRGILGRISLALELVGVALNLLLPLWGEVVGLALDVDHRLRVVGVRNRLLAIGGFIARRRVASIVVLEPGCIKAGLFLCGADSLVLWALAGRVRPRPLAREGPRHH